MHPPPLALIFPSPWRLTTLPAISQHPSLCLFLQPCLLPRASPEAAAQLFFSSGSRLLGRPSPTAPPAGTSPAILALPQGLASAPGRWTHPRSQPPMPRAAFSVTSFCHWFGKQASLLLRCGERTGGGKGSLGGVEHRGRWRGHENPGLGRELGFFSK